MTDQTPAEPLTAAEEAQVRVEHTTPHGCIGVDPIMGRGRRAFGLRHDGVQCDAARLLATLDAARAARPSDGLRTRLADWLASRDRAVWSSGWSDDFQRGYDAAVEEARALLGREP